MTDLMVFCAAAVGSVSVFDTFWKLKSWRKYSDERYGSNDQRV